MSVPNQKKVIIHKPKYKGNFLQIGIDEWQQAIKTMKKVEFALYLYLASNKNEYSLELSRQAFENATGYKKTTYNDAVLGLLKLGYIVPIQGNIYAFYTSPRRRSERAEITEKTEIQINGGQSSPKRSVLPFGTTTPDRSANTEIDKKIIYKINNDRKKKEKTMPSLAEIMAMDDNDEPIRQATKPKTEQEELVMRVRGYF